VSYLAEQSTPWAEPSWRAEVTTWVDEHLRAHGLTVTGEFAPRLRGWSVTVRIPTDRGPVWFKANPPGSRFEPELTLALHHWVPGGALRPLAINAERGWSLLPDGGPTLRDLLDAKPDLRAWEELLRQYAVLQRGVTDRVDDLLALGVPDLRAAELPARFAELLADDVVLEQVGVPDGLSEWEYAALCAAGPRLADWCAELAASVVAPTLDHSDLHEGQVFAADDGRYVFFDWGDASIGHPFVSLLVPLRTAAHRFRPTETELARLRDAYLEPWRAEQATTVLRDTVDLAVRLGAISRAASWQRIFPQAGPELRQAHGRSVARWLFRVLEPESM
jgi:hypothetical protein